MTMTYFFFLFAVASSNPLCLTFRECFGRTVTCVVCERRSYPRRLWHRTSRVWRTTLERMFKDILTKCIQKRGLANNHLCSHSLRQQSEQHSWKRARESTRVYAQLRVNSYRIQCPLDGALRMRGEQRLTTSSRRTNGRTKLFSRPLNCEKLTPMPSFSAKASPSGRISIKM